MGEWYMYVEATWTETWINKRECTECDYYETTDILTLKNTKNSLSITDMHFQKHMTWRRITNYVGCFLGYIW